MKLVSAQREPGYGQPFVSVGFASAGLTNLGVQVLRKNNPGRFYEAGLGLPGAKHDPEPT